MTSNDYPGLFITCEGGDGVGKTTQLRSLVDWLRSLGHQVVQTREPGGTTVGAVIREIVLHHPGIIDPRAEALLYAADRAQHIATVVRPALAEGKIVVQDRYIDSSIAYQASGRELSADEVRDLSAWATSGLQPDMTVLLDLDPGAAHDRVVAASPKLDRLESEGDEFRDRVRAAYLEIARAEPDRCLIVDASQSIDAVAQLIRERVSDVLALRART